MNDVVLHAALAGQARQRVLEAVGLYVFPSQEMHPVLVGLTANPTLQIKEVELQSAPYGQVMQAPFDAVGLYVPGSHT